MMHHLSLREVNQNFALHIKSVETGNEIILTRHGKAIAKIIPFTEDQGLTDAQQIARERLLKKTTEGFSLKNAPFDRANLHER